MQILLGRLRPPSGVNKNFAKRLEGLTNFRPAWGRGVNSPPLPQKAPMLPPLPPRGRTGQPLDKMALGAEIRALRFRSNFEKKF